MSRLTQQLIEALRCLPGVGPKSAQRMAYALLTRSGRLKAAHLVSSVQNAIEKLRECERCRDYTETPVCDLCNHPKRNTKQLCVVESPTDLRVLEETHVYNGLYFVLHGRLSPLDGIGPAEVGLPLLMERLKQEAIEELVIATNPTMEGKATAHYIATHVGDIRCTRLTHGVPLGGELEYLDGGTLALAFDTRSVIQD